MPINNETMTESAATPTKKVKRQYRKTAKVDATAAKARDARNGYKQEAEQLRSEIARLKSKIARLEARPESSFESSLILRTATDSFEAGVKQGLMFQDSNK